jgi:hypothetical protein
MEADMQYEMNPVLTKGKIVQVNDTAIKVDIQGRLGVVTVPRRWVFTDSKLKKGQKVEFYFSYMQIVEENEV